MANHGNDWFSLGGVIFDQSDEEFIRERHEEFCTAWKIEKPLHSSEIRARASAFAFVGAFEKSEQDRFYEELYCLMRDIPVFGIACVIDRPGYNNRYLDKYDEEKRWLLCKSAFSICVERAAKFASSKDAKLRVYIERADKKTDRLIESYYNEMREEGMPFADATSAKYEPSEKNDLKNTLYEFRTKAKTSPLIQFADLFLWPICMGGYNPKCRPFKRLFTDSKLIDCVLKHEDVAKNGIKYYCFDKKKPS